MTTNKLYHMFSVVYGELSPYTNLTLEELIDYIIDQIDLDSFFDSALDDNEEFQLVDEEVLLKISDGDLIQYVSDKGIKDYSEHILKECEYNYDITDSKIYYSESDGKLKVINPEKVVSQDNFCELFRKKWKEIYAK